MGEDEIRRILPHRYPFLLVDCVLEWGERRVRTLKNVTRTSRFLQDTFRSALSCLGS